MRPDARLDDYFFSDKIWAESISSFVRKIYRKETDLSAEDDLGLTWNEVESQLRRFKKLAFAGIRSGTFALQPARKLVIFADKTRIITRFCWFDRLLLHHFANSLQKVLLKRYPPSLYSFIPGRRHFDAISSIRNYIRSSALPAYVVRVDIKDFGDSVLPLMEMEFR